MSKKHDEGHVQMTGGGGFQRRANGCGLSLTAGMPEGTTPAERMNFAHALRRDVIAQGGERLLQMQREGRAGTLSYRNAGKSTFLAKQQQRSSAAEAKAKEEQTSKPSSKTKKETEAVAAVDAAAREND